MSEQQESIERLLVRAIVAGKVKLPEPGLIAMVGDGKHFTRKFMVTTDEQGVPKDYAVLRESLEKVLA